VDDDLLRPEVLMRAPFILRLSMAAVTVVVVALFAAAALEDGSVSSGQVLLAVAGFVFAYIVVRLTHTLIAANAARRRKARRALILAAAVPALVLTPTVIGSSPPQFTPMILLASTVWLALAMAFTSYLLAKATKSTAHAAPRQRRGPRVMKRRDHVAARPLILSGGNHG
jgi:hypothetical protein